MGVSIIWFTSEDVKTNSVGLDLLGFHKHVVVGGFQAVQLGPGIAHVLLDHVCLLVDLPDQEINLKMIIVMKDFISWIQLSPSSHWQHKLF